MQIHKKLLILIRIRIRIHYKRASNFALGFSLVSLYIFSVLILTMSVCLCLRCFLSFFIVVYIIRPFFSYMLFGPVSPF
jgi:hypothetical protein